MHSLLRRAVIGVVWALALTLLPALGLSAGQSTQDTQASEELSGSSAVAAPPTRPDVVMFLMDDMPAALLQHMPNARRYIFDRGATFTNYFANISLCCAARATMFSGDYAHNTGILTNIYPGGVYGFLESGGASNSYPRWLQQEGYWTSLQGKYLNGYPHDPYYTGDAPLPREFVPAGYDDWAVPVSGMFFGNKYTLNENGVLQDYDVSAGGAYLGDLMADRLTGQLPSETPGDRFFLYSSYAPHGPEPASPQERMDPNLRSRVATMKYPRTPDFNEADVSDKPPFIRALPRLTAQRKRAIDRIWRRRIISAKTVDRHIGEVVAALETSGQLDDTYLVFASDNGYHQGEHRLKMGKNLLYDPDIRLPFAISGPGVTAGTVVDKVVGHVDLAPTMMDIAGATPPREVDGESLLPLAQGQTVNRWRDYFLVQRGSVTEYESPAGALEPGTLQEQLQEQAIPGYLGAVSKRFRYFEYFSGDREYYDIAADPYQLDNLMGRSKATWTRAQTDALPRLRGALAALDKCSGEACRVMDGDLPPPPPGPRTCTGELGRVTVRGDLVVPQGASCVLDRTVIEGDLLVRTGASLDSQGANIKGDVYAYAHRRLQLRRAQVGQRPRTRLGQLYLQRAGATSVLGARLEEGVEILQSRRRVLLQGSTVKATVVISDDRRRTVLRSNVVEGHVDLRRNRRGLVLERTVIGFDLTCRNNQPAPVLRDNDVAGIRRGQCLARYER